MRIKIVLITCMIALQAVAQEEKLRVSFRLDEMPNVGLNVNDIKEISFMEEEMPLNIEGEWFDIEDDVFQSLIFYEDGTIKHYYYYTGLPLCNTESGKYWFQYDVLGISLQLWGNQYLPIVNYTENSFTWRYFDQNFTYYRVMNVYEMEIDDEPISIGNDGDIITYVDNVFIGLENGKVKAMNAGTGFVLVEDTKQNICYAVRIEVKEPFNVIDWAQYFRKPKKEIVKEFGDSYKEDADWITYIGETTSTLKFIGFSFYDITGNVKDISITFNKYEDFQAYYDYINSKYILSEKESSSTRKIYYDTEVYSKSSTIKIVIDTIWMNIGFSDLKPLDNKG